MAKNLVIVESPAKAKTIENYLGKDFTVKSSFGHVRDLPKSNVAIDLENNFEPVYEVSPDKKKLVNELTKLAKKAETVWLATDEDREGEAISWHLTEALELDDSKIKRIVFHEITKPAILKAIETPRAVDINLVNAQQARRVLDRLVGFELSPVLWKKVRPKLSAGRVQSVAVRIIVEREREIGEFLAVSSYRVVAFFETDTAKFKAELTKKLKTIEEARAFLQSCVGSDYKVDKLEKKPSKKSPAPPFTTSTLQQEASRKLGFSVTQTMVVAQKLYESGRITYMRTDSVNLSDLALTGAKDAITDMYGAEYSKTRKFTSKAKGAQEAHEAIRPTNLALHNVDIDRNEKRLYELIWKRTIASQMSDAQLEKTTANISISGNSEHFVARGEMIKFEGFLKVYLEGTDDEGDEQKGMLPPLQMNQTLSLDNITATERFTKHPARYTEASLVKKLEELGIGRPSTYAPTISTVQKRGYVVKESREGTQREYNVLQLASDSITENTNTENTGAEKNKLFPTDIGMVVTDFLVENFKNVLNYNFTASVEEEFDDIADGKLVWKDMIGRFYTPFHKNVETTLEHSKKATGERELGKDPETGKPVYSKIGRYGPMVQIGLLEDDDKKFASLRNGQSINTLTLEEALELFQFPKNIGDYRDKEVIVSQGRFGPYVKFDEKFISLDKDEDINGVDIERAIELILAKEKADAPIATYENLPVQKGKGRFGPFIKWNNMFINVNRKYDFDNLSFEDITQLIEDKKRKEIEKYIHRWDDEGISLQKARWGRFNIVKGKLKIELPKTTDAEAMTLEDVKKIIEQNAPKKKTAAKKTTKKRVAKKKK